jgi:hypothetical protein
MRMDKSNGVCWAGCVVACIVKREMLIKSPSMNMKERNNLRNVHRWEDSVKLLNFRRSSRSRRKERHN